MQEEGIVAWDAILKWAADDMRSANAQVEFILRKALRDAGRLPTPREGDGVVVEYAS